MNRKWIVSACCVFAVVGLGFSFGAWQRAGEARAAAAEARKERAAAMAEEVETSERLNELNTSIGREREARKRGFVGDGEARLTP